MVNERQPPIDAAVTQTLAEMKRRGCSILYVGAACSAHGDACHRISGYSNDAHERLLVRTDGSQASDTDGTVIDVPTATRSTAAIPQQTPPTLDLDRLQRDITTTMETLSAEVSPESDLRVCVDSLRPLVDTTDKHRLCDFLDSLSDASLSTGALVHTHLPASFDAVPAWLFDSFDAVVELSGHGSMTYQRWHVPTADAPTEWLEV